MSKVKKAYAAQVETLGPRQVRVICTTGGVDRAGEEVMQDGVDLAGFAANPIILWAHDPEQPIGTASEITKTGQDIRMLVDFAPEGISAKADEICGLVKAGVIKTVSIGFDPIEMEPMDPRMAGKKNAPQRYLKSELMETSFVSIPANKGAVVISRAAQSGEAEDWKVGAARDLEIDMESDWAGRDAAERILDDAGFNGDEPDAAKAKRGFLVYDASNPTLKGSYKLPFADIKDGKLVAVASGIRAAASRVPQTDIPDDVKEAAQKVIAAYEDKMKAAEDAKKSAAARRTKTLATKRGDAMKVKGLYDIGRLACMLESLGWLQSSARIEAALEGDESDLPAKLAAVMQDMGAALIAMTQEEVAEAIAEAKGSLGEEEQLGDMDDADATIVLAGKTPAVRRFRAGLYQMKAAMAPKVKAGKKISAATAEALKGALEMHESAMDHHREAMKALTKGNNVIKGLIEGADADAAETDGDSRETQTSGGTDESGGSANGKSAMAARKKAAEMLRARAA